MVSDLSGKMRLVRLDEVGQPENLKIVEVDIPEVSPDDVLIKTELAGLIYGDTEARRGTYFSTTFLPHYPGREVAGTVVKVGENVREFKAGDRVIALVLAGKCCADYVRAPLTTSKKPDGSIIPPADIIKIPDSVAFESALPYLVNYRLAHLLFHGSSKVPKGSRILVHGGSGGMGSMVTQLARAHDCFTISTCRTPEEAEFCRRAGADEVILTGQEDYVARVQELTKGEGVHFSFNGVGGDTLDRDTEILVPFGEIQAYGYVAGKSLFDVHHVNKCIALKTFSADDFFPTPMFPAATKAMLEWFKTGKLLPVETILPLSEVVEANRLLDSGKILGKIGLKP